MINRIFFFFISAFLSQGAYSQSDWVLKKEKNGIFVYELKKDTAAFNAIKVEAELIGKVEDLVFLVMDVEHHHEWAYGTRSATVLKRISETEIIFYKEIKSPGPVSDRDMVIRLKVLPGPEVKSARIESVALPAYVPPKEDLVRVPFSNETWVITTVAGQKIKISYYLKIDPGGSLPPLLVNLFVSRGPMETFEKLKELLKKRSGG